MDEIREVLDLYKRAEELRWQGDTAGARVFLKRAILASHRALDTIREPLLCQDAVKLLSMCVNMSDGLEAVRR